MAHSPSSMPYSITTTTVTATLTQDHGTIIVQPSGSEAIPSLLPHAIVPPSGIPEQPPNTTIAEIGFLYPLNYPFVLANDLSQAQIFNYLSQGVAHGLVLEEESVITQSLRAYDTTETLHYVTILARIYIPSHYADNLNTEIQVPSSRLYHNTNAKIKSLMLYINPAFPIDVDSSLDPNATTATSPSKSKPGKSASSNSTSSAPSLPPTGIASSANASLSLGSKIGVGIAIPLLVVALLLLGLLNWRKRRAIGRSTDHSTATEKDTDDRRYEVAPDAIIFELPVAEYIHEMPTEECEILELQGDLRMRQELKGSEHGPELEARVG